LIPIQSKVLITDFNLKIALDFRELINNKKNSFYNFYTICNNIYMSE